MTATRKLYRREMRRQAELRYLRHRQRNALAQPGLFPFVVVLDHLKAGFNVAKIFRSAEVLGAQEVHLIGIGQFDPAPSKGGFKNVPARFFETFEESLADLTECGYTLFALEADAEQGLFAVELPRLSAFVVGHEEFGLSFDRASYPQIRGLSVPQFGRIESLNVAVAASVVMYEYTRQWHREIAGAPTTPEGEGG